ncbi:ABC transporter ATP-binding protein [Enterococcus songbeiensis]|uniref:ABC transporter ATP-binding protein n=1 Tax=Enterococcus songbeiensis TaxID=2559927 RepID=UPI0010F5B330|nr:ABC transporter ATP-binding protein [Enterococcus songbeiensis]
MAMIQTQQLTKMYGKQRGILDITLSVEKGEIFGFIGPNGAGKSTTIRLLLAMLFPTSGTAMIDGKDCFTQSREVKQLIGYTPATVNYYKQMTAEELLRYSAKFYRKDCANKMMVLAERLNLDLTRKIKTLSSGNKKKVGIIQALQHEPNVLIFDEPTSGLDPFIQNQFFDLLAEEKKKGVTILFSSHVMSEVERICDRVAIIQNGQLLKVERMEQLTRSRFKRIYVRYQELPDFSDLKKSDFQQTKNSATFLYEGELPFLLATINQPGLLDLKITEPSLEEVVMQYYEGREEK